MLKKYKLWVSVTSMEIRLHRYLRLILKWGVLIKVKSGAQKLASVIRNVKLLVASAKDINMKSKVVIKVYAICIRVQILEEVETPQNLNLLAIII